MAVHLSAPLPESIFNVKGVTLGVAQAGIRKAGKDDLTVIILPPESVTAGVFTQNRFCAAPVQVCQQHLKQTSNIRALVINTGNANAGTGQTGLDAANNTCAAMGALLQVDPSQVLPFSTGVIMETLPVERLIDGLPTALGNANEAGWIKASSAIMTTDTLPKAASRQIELDGERISITGISKGSGMIHPNMATMLGFIATDAKITPELLNQFTKQAANASFNRITVDGDTSTNDSFIVMATQQQNNHLLSDANSPQAKQFYEALEAVATELAHAIVRDGEGATKFIEIIVEGGKTEQECKQAAYAIAHSPLVKTAFFASDPNLGRILAAVGYAGIEDLDQTLISLHLDDVHVVENGGRKTTYQEEDGARVMAQDEITIRVGLGRGSASATVWTCDFSHEYVSINADYRS